MSSGAKQGTSYGIEATPGVVATTWQTLAFSKNGMDASPKTTESQTIKDTRIAAGALVTSAEFQGDIETEFAYGIQDVLLEGVAFNQWVNNVLTFGGTTRKTFSIVRGFTDVDNYHVFKGCHVNQWKLTIPEDGIVTSVFSIMGMGRTAYEVHPTGAITPTADAVQFTTTSAGEVLIDGEKKAGMCVTQIDLTIDNAMQLQKCLDFENNIGAILETVMKGTGTFTLAWSKNTAELYEKQFLNEPIGLEYTLKDSAGNKYKLALPKLTISAPLPSGAIGDILSTQFTFAVADIAPTLTRIPVVVGP